MTQIESRFRTALLLVAGWICVGTPIELILMKHVKSPSQFIPFVLCGIGLGAILMVLVRPRRLSLLGLRTIMGMLLLGSVLGIHEHLEANTDFVFEMHPNAALADVWVQIAQGAAPLLAPSILALAAILAILATYAHPALQPQTVKANPRAPEQPIAHG